MKKNTSKESRFNFVWWVCAMVFLGAQSPVGAISLPIISGLSNETVVIGGAVSFNPTVTNATLIQWSYSSNGVGTNNLVNGTRAIGDVISGSTTSQLIISNAVAASAGTYFILASNQFGTVSSNATLTVLSVPVITSQPVSTNVTSGSNVKFTVVAIGAPLLTYQWQYNGLNVGGGTGSALSLTGVTIAKDGSYQVVVTNVYGKATSAVATLTIVTLPTIVNEPGSETVNCGSAANFSVLTASATGYQWYFDGVALSDGAGISGSATTGLTLSGVGVAEAGSYYLEATNGFGSTNSTVAILTVDDTNTPTVTLNGNATVTVNCGSSGSYTDPGATASDVCESGLTVTNAVLSGTTGATFESLYSFTTNGEWYSAGLGQTQGNGLAQGVDGNLYGTTPGGGTGAIGTIYRTTTNGTITNLYNFDESIGAYPGGTLTPGSNGLLYGTATVGGTEGLGSIYSVTTNGVASLVYSFTGLSDGDTPIGRLAGGAGGVFYGTTYGYALGIGAIFELTGGGVNVLQSSGDFPLGVTLGKDGNLYGMTYGGGIYGYGSIFKISTNGGNLTTLYTYTTSTGFSVPSELTQASDGNLYGTTYSGGTYNDGVVFRMTTNGTYTVLYSFSGGADGLNPYCSLVEGADGKLYGTTIGEAVNYGTVYRISTSGVLETLYTFTNGVDGGNPSGDLLLASDGSIYGATTAENGTLYKLAPSESVALSVIGTSTMIYRAGNTGGVVGSTTRTVTVVDTNTPVVTVLGNATTNIPEYSPFVDPGAVASDGCASVLPVTTLGFVNYYSPGAYVLTYIAANADGISATNYRTADVTGADVFSGLTASQSISYGASSITLAGTVSYTYGSSPIYPAEGETITVSINGSAQSNTINDATGDFSFSYNPSTIPASATPYPILYGYGGDSSLSSTTDASTALTVNQAVPTISWASPAPIAYGTPLSSNQLNATTSVAGAFSYVPTNGSILTAGAHTLFVAFTPTDTNDYAIVTNSVSLLVGTTGATPYASGVTNNNGTIQYYLNAAPTLMTVVVTLYPDGSHPALTPATPVQGLNSFSLGTNKSYTISVSQTGLGMPALQSIFSNSTAQAVWGTVTDPRGLDVNCYAKNGPVFGTVYMDNAFAGGTGSQVKGKGLFPCHSDLSLGFGATTNGLGGATFANSGINGPFQIGVSRYDGSVFVGDVSVAAATVWQFDPYLKTPTQILGPIGNAAGLTAGVHGAIYGHPATTGSLASGNLVLYTFDNTMPTPATLQPWFGGLEGAIGYGASYYNGTLLYTPANPNSVVSNSPGSVTCPSDYQILYRYRIGSSSSVPWTNVPDLAIGYGLNFSNSLPGDVEVAPDGKLFTASERFFTGNAPWLMVFDSTGNTNLFCSTSSASSDIIHDQVQATGYDNGLGPNGNVVRVSPDDKYVALGGKFGYIAIYALTNGVPDITTFTFIANPPITNIQREVAWDAADNIYSISSGSGNVNIYGLGQTTTCVTSNDYTSTNGSFTLNGVPLIPTIPAGGPGPLEMLEAPPEYVATNCGSTVVLTAVVANATGYQWSYGTGDVNTPLTDGGGITGSQTASLTLANVTVAEEGEYLFVATNNDSGYAETETVLDVTDTNTPVVTVLGNAETNIVVGSTFTDPGATANDACTTSLPVTTTGTVDEGTPGIYILSYVATNPTGTPAATNTRTVTVNVFVFSPVVTTTADSGTGSLRSIVASATNGSTITFATGLSGQTITLTSGEILLSSNVTIDASALPGGLTLNGNGASRVLDVASGVTVVLNDLALVNGLPSNGSGGGIFNSGTLTLNECNVADNTTASGNGGGIFNGGTLTLTYCSVAGNTADTGAGGGIYNGGTLMLNECTVADNSADSGDGGSIYNGSILTLNNVTLTWNSGYNGGGIDNYGTLVANDSTLYANSSTGTQAGGALDNNGTATLNECTVTGNSAPKGGGLGNNANLTVNQSSVVSNTASVYAGGIRNYFAVLVLVNSIVADNSSPGGASILNSGGTVTETNDLIDIEPLLASLGYYGGPTETMPPLPGSPAIDGCTSGTSFTTDQRGYPRIVGPYADIGSVEDQSTLPVIGTQPSSTTNVYGSTAVFNVGATGTGPLSYQWYFGGQPMTDGGASGVSGSQTTSLTLANLTIVSQGAYTVVVSNSAGAITSAPALVSVLDPGIVTQPVSVGEAFKATGASLSVTAAGSAPLQYQWHSAGGAAVNGASSATFSPSATALGSNIYYVVVSNGNGSVTSQPALFVVYTPPSITKQPAAVRAGQGANATFSVAATGTGPFYYQWSFKSTAIPGATASNYTVVNVQSANVGNYICTVTNAWGAAATSSASAGGLTLLANTIAPLVAVGSPGANTTFVNGQTQTTSNQTVYTAPQFVLTGTASDKFVVSSVSIQRTNPVVDAPVSGNLFSVGGAINSVTFTNVLTLGAGTNIYRVWATDGAGLHSKTNVLPLFFQVLSPLTININPAGAGSTAPKATSYGSASNGAMLVVGEYYSVTAVSGANATFTNWTGAATNLLTNGSTLTFQMVSNLVLNANFVTAAPPAITAGPTNSTVNFGGNATLTVSATGSSPLSYQWYRNGNPVSGGTASALTMTKVTDANAGTYKVVVGNALGTATSAGAALNVYDGPVIVAQPGSQALACGTPLILGAAVTASTSLSTSYQWYDNGNAVTNGGSISGAQTQTLTISPIAGTNAGGYTLAIFNSAGSATSQVATISVTFTEPPVIALSGSQTMTLECSLTNAVFLDPGATALDQCSNPVPVVELGTVTAGVPGTYYVTYTATDAGGDISQTVRTVAVVDTTPPVITVDGANPDNIGTNTTFVDPGATANDTCAGIVSVTTLGTVNTATVGAYELTYIANDGNGNAATNYRTVVVLAEQALTIAVQPESVTVPVGASATFYIGVNGSPVLYQWYSNSVAESDGGIVSGSLFPTLVLSNVPPSASALYQVVATNDLGSVTSVVAVLQVTGLQLDAQALLGGTVNESGTSAAIGPGSLFVAGSTGLFGTDGLIAKYSLPMGAGALPMMLTNWPSVTGPDHFNGLAAGYGGVYAVGDSYSQTKTSSGTPTNKGVVVEFPFFANTDHPATGAGGSLLQAQVPPPPGAFSFSGNGTLNSIVSSTEGTSNYFYVAGTGQSSAANAGRMFLAKVGLNGSTLWTWSDIPTAGAPTAFSSGHAVAILNSNVFVAGETTDIGTVVTGINTFSISNGTGSRARLQKFDTQGNLVFSILATNGLYNAITAYGGALYCGGTISFGGNPAYLIQKFDETGNVLWTQEYGAGGNGGVINGIVGLNGSLYAVGDFVSVNGDSDAVILELDPATGSLLSETTAGGSGQDYANAVTTDGQQLYVVGTTSSYSGNGTNQLWVLDYEANEVPPELSVLTTNLPPGLASVPYQATVQAAGGAPGYTWSVASGTLPAGISMNGNGLITGTTTQTGSYAITLQAQDADGNTATQSVALSFYSGASAPSVSLTSPANGASYTAPATLTLVATATSTPSVAVVNYYMNSTLLGGQSAGGPAYNFFVSGLTNGSYAFYAVAVNTAGLMATSGVAHVTVVNAGTQLIDFEALDASGGPVNGAALSNYLAGDGIRISNVTAGTTLEVENENNVLGGGRVIASSGVNLLNQVGTGVTATFTMVFGQPYSSVSFTRTLLVAGTTGASSPAWTATAYDSHGNSLGSVSESRISSLTNVPASAFTLVGPNIASVTFTANSFGLGALISPPLDDFVLSTNVVTSQLSVALTSPVNLATYIAPAQIVLSATAIETGLATVNQIQFFEGASLVGTVSGGSGSVMLNNVAAGTYVFTAVASDSAGAVHTSAAVTNTVSAVSGVTVINFDSLNGTAGAVGGTSLSNYLAGYGIGMINVTTGTRLEAVNANNFAGGNTVAPSSPPNLFTQVGLQTPVSFTLTFAKPLQSFGMTREGLIAGGGGISHPQWTASAFNAAGTEVAAFTEPFIQSATNVPARAITLVGTNITSVRFDSDSKGVATFAALLLDDVVLITNTVVHPISVAISSPASGSTFTAPASITLGGTSADSVGTISYVAFYSGPSLIGVVSNSPYNFTWTNVLAGTYSISAQVVDSAGLAIFSAPISITVNASALSAAVINFDSLNATGGPVSGTPLSSYLAGYGVGITNVSPGTTVSVENQNNIASGQAVAASSPPNLLTQLGSNGPVSFTLNFQSAVSQFGFTRPTLLASPFVSHPAWQVTAYDAVGVPLAQTSAPAIASYSNVNSQSYVLNGPGIASVQFSSQGSPLTTFSAMLVDDVVLATNHISTPPAVAITSPPAGQTFVTPSVVSITAAAADAFGTITHVSFYTNGSLLGTDLSAPYSINWTNTVPGLYALTAVAADSGGLMRTSPVVSVTFISPPTVLGISSQPTNLITASGAPAAFYVTATGTNLTYQWYQATISATNSLAGQTGSTLLLPGVSDSSAGTYFVQVNSGAAFVDSQGATLTVLDGPVITIPPQGQTANVGDTVTFTAAANGASPLAYQWQENGASISGATGSAYLIASAQVQSAGNYSVVVTNSVGLAQSLPANLSVLSAGVSSESADNFEDRIAINPLQGYVLGNNENATFQPGEPLCDGKPGGKSIWYSWKASFNGVVSFTTLGSSFDTLLAVYVGDTLTNLTPIASDDDSGGYFTSLVTFNVTQGVTYDIQVDGFQGASGSVVLGLPSSAGYHLLSGPQDSVPIITSQPQDVVVQAGQTATLSLEATNASSYQWYYQNSPIPNATEAELNLTNFQASECGNYYALAVNEVGSVQSDTVSIQIGVVNSTNANTISSQDKFGDALDTTIIQESLAKKKNQRPVDGGDTSGFTVSQTFSTVGATKEEGEPDVCGQAGGASRWYDPLPSPVSGTLHVDTDGSSFNTLLGVFIGPASASFETITNLDCGYTTNHMLNGQPSLDIPNVPANAHIYVSVDGYNGASGSVVLHYFLGHPASIATPPQDQYAGLNQSATFNVVAGGTTNYSYQWLFNGAPIATATASAYTIGSVASNSTGQYSVVVTNLIGAVTSSPAQLHLQFAPYITVPPQNTTIAMGGSSSSAFGVTVAGAGPFHYQWRYNDGNINRATNSTLPLSNVSWTNSGSYSVIVTNTLGAATSTPGILTVSVPTPPTVAVTSPKNNASLSTTSMNLVGTASSYRNVPLAHVMVTVNTNAPVAATGTKNWTFPLGSLVPGTNTVTVQSMDAANNLSTPLSEKLILLVKSPLTVHLTPGINGSTKSIGPATFGKAANGASLDIGFNYTIAAVPGKNVIFTNWTDTNGAVLTTNLQYSFTMSTNLTLNANFLTNPIMASGTAGSYNGLFYQTNLDGSPSFDEFTGGFVGNLVLQSNRIYSGTLTLNGSSYSIAGTFDLNGNDTEMISRSAQSKPSLTVALHVNWNVPSTLQITGTVSSTDHGSWTSTLLSVLGTNKLHIAAGRYTMLVPPGAGAPDDSPGGSGYAQITNSTKGVLTLAGVLADNAAFSQTVPLAQDGSVPVYIPLYSNTGFLAGWLNFGGNSSTNPTGVITWIKPSGATLYPSGFTNTVAVQGSTFHVPARNHATIAVTNQTLSIDGAAAGGEGLVFTVNLTTANAIVESPGHANPTNSLSGLNSVSTQNGIISISFGASGVPGSQSGSGAVLQNINTGGGYWIAPDNTSRQFNLQ